MALRPHCLPVDLATAVHCTDSAFGFLLVLGVLGFDLGSCLAILRVKPSFGLSPSRAPVERRPQSVPSLSSPALLQAAVREVVQRPASSTTQVAARSTHVVARSPTLGS